MLGRWQKSAHDGVVERYLDDDGRLIRQQVEDVEPLIDNATRVRNDLNGDTPGGMRQIGSVPRSIWKMWEKEWVREGLVGPGIPCVRNELAKAKLRDRNFSKFRTTDASF